MTQENVLPSPESTLVKKIEIAINLKLIVWSLLLTSLLIVGVVGGTVVAIRTGLIAATNPSRSQSVQADTKALMELHRRNTARDTAQTLKASPNPQPELSLFDGIFANLSVFGESVVDLLNGSPDKKSVGEPRKATEPDLIIEKNLVVVQDLAIEMGKPEVTSVPAIVHKLMPEKARLIEIFKLENLPLTAWSIQPQPDVPRAEIIYTTPDGRYAFVGPLLELDQSGHVANMTTRLAEEHGPKIDLNTTWSSLASTAHIKEGSTDDTAKFIMYGFMDPNCGYCYQAWSLLSPYLKAGLQIRWIPVAVIDPTTSKTKVAALLESKDPIAAIQSAYKLWPTKKAAAFEPVKMITPDIENKIDQNNKTMMSLGAFGTPAFVYKDSAGNVKKVAGFIPAQDIEKITGITLQSSRNALLGQSSR